jgi:hypothetical protein
VKAITKNSRAYEKTDFGMSSLKKYPGSANGLQGYHAEYLPNLLVAAAVTSATTICRARATCYAVTGLAAKINVRWCLFHYWYIIHLSA